MKMKQDHIVPLSRQDVAILRELGYGKHEITRKVRIEAMRFGGRRYSAAMPSVDSNVLVRLLAADDAKQAA